MIQTLGISIIVALIGYFILDIFVDGVLQDPFAKTVVYAFQRLGMQEEEAIHLYRLIFWQNKVLIIGAGFSRCCCSAFIWACPNLPTICGRWKAESR